MKRLALIILLLLGVPTAALAAFAIFQTATPSATPNPNLRQENFFGLTGSAWQFFVGNYTPGLGAPAVSTADYYHAGGVFWMRPNDLLDSACGAAGASIAASRGRYVWLFSQDHADGNYSFQDELGMFIGFSNDPGVPPSRVDKIFSADAYAAQALATIATVTASIGNGVGGAGNSLIVTAVAGTLSFDANAVVNGTGVTQASITAQASGAPGSTGTFTIDGAAQNVASRTMTISQTAYIATQSPWLVCNPDDVTNPFYVYAEGFGNRTGLEEAVRKTADFVTWTPIVPTHVSYLFGGFSAYQRIVRTGVNTWYSTGFQANFPQTSNAFGKAKWTSTDGISFVPNPSTLLNTCVPANASGVFGAQPCTASTAIAAGMGGAPPSVTIGAQTWALTDLNTIVSSTRSGNQWVGRAPIDANFNIISSPSIVNISAPYAGLYPGPTYLNNASGYVEDGIAHYYANVGFPPSTAQNGLVSGVPYLNGGACTPGTGTTNCGGLWQQGLDYYTEIVDASAAATAAPIGVNASCASSIASLTWFNALPQQTYRLYRGTTAGTQATLVGDFTGTTATDSGMTLNAITYYKLVYLHSGVEQKNRVVSTYCSSSIYPEVNAHLTRVSAAGADMTTCNRTFMDTFYAWLTSNGLKNNLLFATMPEFCVAKSGSVITKIFDMGTTRLPRGGDYTPLTANTTYNATGISGLPAWVNSASTANGYYGGGRFNNIRRKTQITLFAAYQKPGTSVATPFVMGQFSNRMMLSHTTGTPGAINFLLTDATHQVTATATVSGLATDFHTMMGTFDGTTLLAYSDGVAGGGQTGLVIPSPNLIPPDDLTGGVGPTSLMRTLISGADAGQYLVGTGYTAGNAAQYSGRAQMIFDVKLTGAQGTSLDALVR